MISRYPLARVVAKKDFDIRKRAVVKPKTSASKRLNPEI